MLKQTLLTTTFIAAMGLATFANAKDFSKSDIESIIKEFIKNNPEVILDSVENHSRNQQNAENKKRQEMIKQHLGWFENNSELPVAGNPDGDVTVIEFFDYNCGYCKKAMDDVLGLLEEDKDVKFIFIETPILGQTSQLAARWAMAAAEQDAYLEYHIGLMRHNGPITPLSLRTIAKKTGLDVEKLQKDAESSKISKKVKEKAKKASEMGINGTPAFIIDGELFGGYIGLDRMKQAIADAREG